MDSFANFGGRLKYAPIANRMIMTTPVWDEDAPFPSTKPFLVELLPGAVDTNQRIYIRADILKGEERVSVFQADEQIGILSGDPRVGDLTRWLLAWFDGGIYIVPDFSWDNSLYLHLELYLEMSRPYMLKAIDLLPSLDDGHHLKFEFKDIPDQALQGKQAGFGCESHEKIELHWLNPDFFILEVFGMLSDALPATSEVLSFFREGQPSITLRSKIQVLHGEGGPAFSVALYGSFRKPLIQSEKLAELPTFKRSRPNFSEEFFSDIYESDFY